LFGEYEDPQKEDDDRKKKRIENHHFLKLLNGHPQAIGLVASLLQNHTLSEVYEKTREDMLDTFKIPGVSEEDSYKTSIKSSLDISIEFLRKTHYDTVRFFAMFGLLPGGI